MRILGLSGSLRRGSHNTRLLRAAAGSLPPGAELALWEGVKHIPPFDEDDEHAPPAAVADLRLAVEAADALLVATPEYNGSVPGQLKNALDWLSRPFATNPLRGKPAAVVGASTGMFGAVWAQADARRVLGRIGARVVDAELPVAHFHERLGDDGRLDDEALAAQLHELLRVLCSLPDHASARAA
jgi:chromate reductase, NAD(P)H dehydrogenase (quinone)